MYSRHNFENFKLRYFSRYGVYIYCSRQTQPVEFTKDDAELLFGPDADYKAAFEELDTDEDGEVREASRGRDSRGDLIQGGLL